MVALSENPRSPMATAVRQKRLLLIRDFGEWGTREKQSVVRLFDRNYQSNSCILAPLLSGENILGVLNLADKIGGLCFDTAADLPPVQLLCEIIGSALSNIRLYDEVHKQARTDGMTGLVNHRTFYDELDQEISRSRRYGSSLSLVVIDLDDLKRFNDDHGHRAGDAVLMHVAHQIRQCVRETDVAARYGGDEFAIILPNTSLTDAMTVAQRLMHMVRSQPVRVGKHRLNASVSVGIGQYRAGLSAEDFMNQSDAALLAAKTSGKNRIHVFEPTPK
jgi:diguanylate cyclase (GGDEF)-like protein